MQRGKCWLLIAFAGVFLCLLGVGGGALIVTPILLNGLSPTSPQLFSLTGIVGLGLAGGAILLWNAWSGWRGRLSPPFAPRGLGWGWLLWVLLAGVGTVLAAMSTSTWASTTWFPLVYLVVMALPVLLMLGLAGRAIQGGASWREATSVTVIGGSVGVFFALIGEIAAVALLSIGVAIVIALLPGGKERIAEFIAQWHHVGTATVPNFENILHFIVSPGVAVALVGVFTVPVPLIEELAKSLLAAILGAWARPRPSRTWLWGVAGGAGFALLENVFNSTLGGVGAWPASAVARVGATVMHCFTGGLVGWGWGQFWSWFGRDGKKKRFRYLLYLPGAYVAAVLIHSGWNALSVGAVLLSAVTWLHLGGTAWMALAGVGIIGIAAALLFATGAMWVGLGWVGRRLALGSQRPPVPPPPSQIPTRKETPDAPIAC